MSDKTKFGCFFINWPYFFKRRVFLFSFFSQGERTFSEEEEEKLQAALSLDKQALNLVIETSAFVLEQVKLCLSYKLMSTLIMMIFLLKIHFFYSCMYPN